MEELLPKSEYQLLCERIEGKDEDYARQECRNYFDSLVERLRSHISVSEWAHARSVALEICEANFKVMFKEFPRNRLNECISDLCHRVSASIQSGKTYIFPAKPLKYLVTYGEWESIDKAIQLADARVLDELADKYGVAANDYGLTILMPDLPGDLVDENGKVSDYDGIVYRADEVDALLKRKDSEIASLRGLLSRLDMQASEEQRNAAYNRMFRQKGDN